MWKLQTFMLMWIVDWGTHCSLQQHTNLQLFISPWSLTAGRSIRSFQEVHYASSCSGFHLQLSGRSEQLVLTSDDPSFEGPSFEGVPSGLSYTHCLSLCHKKSISISLERYIITAAVPRWGTLPFYLRKKAGEKPCPLKEMKGWIPGGDKLAKLQQRL